MAAVIQNEPRWDGVPATMQRLVRKCLAKDPRQRLRDIGDVWDLIDEPIPTSSAARSRGGGIGWIAAGVMAIAAAVALWAPRGRGPVVDQPFTQLEINLGDDVSLMPLRSPTPSSIAISPDGTRLAFVASVSGGPSQLMLRKLDEPESMELVGTDGASSPFFSPDGEWTRSC